MSSILVLFVVVALFASAVPPGGVESVQRDMCSLPRVRAATARNIAAREMFAEGTNFAGIADVRAERTGLREGQPRCSGSEREREKR